MAWTEPQRNTGTLVTDKVWKRQMREDPPDLKSLRQKLLEESANRDYPLALRQLLTDAWSALRPLEAPDKVPAEHGQ